MTADRFLWIGPGVFWAEAAALGISAGRVSSSYAKVVFAVFSRIPRSAITPDRLTQLVNDGQAKLSDDGIPGPLRAEVAEAFHRTIAMNDAANDEAFKSKLREIFTEARDGVPEAPQSKE